jgi:ketosteroid isomerase-like protein
MKKHFIAQGVCITLLFLALCGCGSKEMTPTESVQEFYQAFDNGNFKRIKPLLADTLTLTEGAHTTNYSKTMYYAYFAWDSVFKPSYKLIDIQEKEDHLLAKVSSASERYAFLKNNPLVCTYRIAMASGKIRQIEVLEYHDADFSVWQQEREALVSWIKETHPELDGFIHDQSLTGAQNYRKAIALYQKRNRAN